MCVHGGVVGGHSGVCVCVFVGGGGLCVCVYARACMTVCTPVCTLEDNLGCCSSGASTTFLRWVLSLSGQNWPSRPVWIAT